MQVSQGFLIGAYQEYAQVILTLLIQRMQRQSAVDITFVAKMIDLAVAITGNVREHCLPSRFFTESVNGHNRKNLIDCPDVGQGLKEAEVAVINVSKQYRQIVEFGRDTLSVGQQGRNFLEDGKAQVLG